MPRESVNSLRGASARKWLVAPEDLGRKRLLRNQQQSAVRHCLA